MFRKILIANRGEIARRIIRTVRRLGMDAVAVFSPIDAGAAHVREADEAIALDGGAYLDGAQIAACARRAGADAVHPGCGFLAESAAFARQCAAAKVAFIGPSPRTLALAAVKSAARDLAKRVGVPILPGASGDAKTLLRAAQNIGYPLLVKAEAGGGGRGIRLVEKPAALSAGLESAAREAAAGFGDAALFLEKYLPRARHIESQILADDYGAIVHLGERDCSLQRRRQKLIEETPAPRLPQRDALHRAARELARAADYRNAGTVEFLIADGGFYFLEINARLQVEHPITEAASGIDLVEWQIRIAAGECLPSFAPPARAAMEARLCAEDPRRDFMPSSGKLSRARLVRGADLRVDGGAEENDEVPPDYDSLIAKIIAVGDDREQARRRLIRALRGAQIGGVAVNAPFLLALLESPDFRAARHHTATVAALSPQINKTMDEQARLFARAAAVYFARGDWWGWRLNRPRGGRLALARRDGAVFNIDIAFAGDGRVVRLSGDAGGAVYRVAARAADSLLLEEQKRTFRFGIRAAGEEGVEIFYNGGGDYFALRRESTPASAGADSASAGDGEIRAPMNAKVAALPKRRGERAAAGETVAVLEAMKMEIALAAPCDGVVRSVAVSVGDAVAAGQSIAAIAPESKP